MRIKSYFAPSVQAAIAMTRKEFEDDVTLVTSHVAPMESRHLGEYEVVFAIEEANGKEARPSKQNGNPEAVPVRQIEKAATPSAGVSDRGLVESIEAPVPQFTAFQEILLGAVNKKPATSTTLERLESVRSSFIELGIESEMVKVLMILVERSMSSVVPELARQPLIRLDDQHGPVERCATIERPRRHRGVLSSSSDTSLSSAEQAFLLSVTAQPAGDRS